jgi:hypothetical protein
MVNKNAAADGHPVEPAKPQRIHEQGDIASSVQDI